MSKRTINLANEHLSAIVEHCPVGILLVDQQRNILFANPCIAKWLGMTELELVGKNFSEVSIEPGHGHAATLFAKGNEQHRPLHFSQQALADDSSHAIYYFTDLSLSEKNNAFSQLVADLNLPQRPSWRQFLEYEVSRSRRYDNPLALIKLAIRVESAASSQELKSIYQAIHFALSDQLRWADMLNHNQQGDFLMVLPETCNEGLASLMRKIKLCIQQLTEHQFKTQHITAYFGAASWTRGDDAESMLCRARANLNEAPLRHPVT